MAEEATHTLICSGCGRPIGYTHDEECPMAPGVVLASQAVDAAEQPRCRECRQRVGQQHLPSCSLARPGGIIPNVSEEDTRNVGFESPELAARAEAVVEELSEPVRPGVSVVLMHDDSDTSPDAVMACLNAHQQADAEVVVGVWASGHVVVGKNRYGVAGTALPAVRNLVPQRSLPPNARQLRDALLAKADAADQEAGRGGIPNHIDALQARAGAFRDAADVIENHDWDS